MPPTDCFGDSEAGSSSLSCSVPEEQQQQQQQQPQQQRGLLPTTRSPLHHGTDPDLSALTPLPPGVAATGLDLSPVTASSCSLQMTKRKKQRGSPARAPPASVPGGLASRGSLSAAARPGPQVRRAATLMPFGSAQRPLSYPSPTAAAATSSSTSLHPSSSTADSAINSSNPGGGASVGSALFNARQAWHRHADAARSSGAAMDEQDREEGQTPDVPSEQVHRLGTGRPCAALGSVVKNHRGGVQPPAAEAEQQEPQQDDDEDGLAPPGLVPLARGGGGQAACAVASSGGCAADSGSESGSRSSSSGGGDVQRRETQLALKSMMDKAKMASENIRLLLHAKRCDGACCKEPGCESARQLVEHMRGCRSTGGAGCHAKCAQAQKMLRHYAECNRKRALGGRYCLVCSLVARSAMSGNSAQNAGDANVGRNRSAINAQGRQPLGHLAPSAAAAAVPRQQTNGGCCGGGGGGGSSGQKNVARAVGVGGVPSPVAITRLRRSDMGQRQVRDGVFFRPLPKTRRGSWGGYDRCRYLRRTRFDSIPEELTEEECDEDDTDPETASDGGSKPIDDASRSKTLVTAHSL